MSKDLTIINQNGQLLADSREVAEMIDKDHSNLMRDIRGYVDILDDPDSKLKAANFFIQSNYMDTQNQSRPCYLLTRKGCDMVANKMTGEKGVLFTATYVTKFEEMEKSLIENRKYEAFPETDNEHLKIAYALISMLGRPNIGKGAQKEIGKSLNTALKLSGVSLKNQKLISNPTPVKTEPTPSDLLSELLSHAVPLSDFLPRSLTELRSSVLYDERFYYIFPWAAERYIKIPDAKKDIYKEIRFLDGKGKNKHFIFQGIDKRVFHVWILPRKAVMLSPLPGGDSSVQVGGDNEIK